MKKTILAFALFVSAFSLQLFSQEAQAADEEVKSEDTIITGSADEGSPDLLKGIWHNYDRYVVFDTGSVSQEGSKLIPDIVLRTFYQWYNDRAGEKTSYERDRNAAETIQAEELQLTFTPLTDELFTSEYGKTVVQEDGDILTAETNNSGAWDITVKYAGHKLGGEDTYHVPVAVIGNKLYLNFALKQEDSDSVPANSLLNGITIQSENLLEGYWRDAGSANGILVCPPVTNTELLSYYITNDSVYYIRYWQTDMEYNPAAEAFFTDGAKTYTVPKHLRSAERTYTCTLGRRSKIRNIKKSSSIDGDYAQNTVLVEKHTKDSDGGDVSYTVRTSTILVFGKPYLTLTDGSRDLKTIVAENNKRRHPAPASPFPPHGVLDFDWSIVENPPESYDRRVLDLGK